MAGIISGNAPANSSFNNKALKEYLSKFEVDVLGIVPSAELLILKCYSNPEIRDANTFSKILNALEYIYIEDVALDIIYIGLALPFIDFNLGKPLERFIDELSKKILLLFALLEIIRKVRFVTPLFFKEH